jgi:uncharacterized OB-fold protein
MSSPPELLLPPVDAESAPFWEGTRQGELRMQQCARTGRLIFPPRARSPFAPHVPPVWTTVSGRGTIWSFVVPHPPLLPAYAELAPYNVILVALDEDPSVRLVGNLVARPGGAINEVDPHSIEIGARVRAVFERVTDEIHLPRWMLAEEKP